MKRKRKMLNVGTFTICKEDKKKICLFFCYKTCKVEIKAINLHKNLKPMRRTLNLVFSLLLLAIVSCSNNEKEKIVENDLQYRNLLGRVKKIEEIVYGEINKENCIETERTISKYDKEGYVMESVDYNPEKSVVSKYIFKRGNGFVERLWVGEDDRFIQKNILYFSKEGRKTKEDIIDKDENLDYRYVYTYGENGRLEEVLYDKKMNTIQCKNNYVIDDEGKKMEEYKADKTGKIIEKISYRYDQMGRVCKEFYHNIEENTKVQTTYKYDQRGNEVQRNIKNLSLGGVEYNYMYVYKYDEKGNWIEGSEYLYGQKQRTIRRNIEYYK